MEYSADKTDKFKWPVSVSQKIEASPKDIWAAIAKPENLKGFHPFCEKNTVLKWPGTNAVDVIHYYSGWVLQRKFTNWIGGGGYDLLIGREGGRQSYVSWRIIEEKGKGALRITLYPHALQKVPVAIRWIPHLTTIQPAMHSYLESVLKGFKWFMTTGKPVIKNQFGSHKWFSTNDA